MRIIEAGHFYQAKGPTTFSELGWGILEKMHSDGDKSLLFIDDVHTLNDVSTDEINLPAVSFSPKADFIVMESAMRDWGFKFLELLKELPKRKRARKYNGNGVWFCSGFPLTNEAGDPLCLLLDAGLTLYKQSLGCKTAINILPDFYQDEQERLLRLVKKAMPDFLLEVVFFNQKAHWQLQPKTLAED